VAEQVLAAVRTAPGTTSYREFPMPDVPADGALLKVEVAGICGTDVKMYASPPFPDPVIMGHENAGVIARAGREFVKRHDVDEGACRLIEIELADPELGRDPYPAPSRPMCDRLHLDLPASAAGSRSSAARGLCAPPYRRDGPDNFSLRHRLRIADIHDEPRRGVGLDLAENGATRPARCPRRHPARRAAAAHDAARQARSGSRSTGSPNIRRTSCARSDGHGDPQAQARPSGYRNALTLRSCIRAPAPGSSGAR